ncbi:Protein of unknown function [Pyronema omphalodes CBS 100304]|uniref:Uncharacterized protein n=1 Tax=Pyronema omphalodes (strain CBS 100304) TaxID=1076935 RepID=U4L7V4_PYROM|nr:Protein of unknown function [Pyronema omphalodes CBS 100304]
MPGTIHDNDPQPTERSAIQPEVNAARVCATASTGISVPVAPIAAKESASVSSSRLAPWVFSANNPNCGLTLLYLTVTEEAKEALRQHPVTCATPEECRAIFQGKKITEEELSTHDSKHFMELHGRVVCTEGHRENQFTILANYNGPRTVRL